MEAVLSVKYNSSGASSHPVPNLLSEFIPSSTIRKFYEDFKDFDLQLKVHIEKVISGHRNPIALFEKLPCDEDRFAITTKLEPNLVKKVAHGNNKFRKSCSQLVEPLSDTNINQDHGEEEMETSQATHRK